VDKNCRLQKLDTIALPHTPLLPYVCTVLSIERGCVESQGLLPES
jgi:hypothetical protein